MGILRRLFGGPPAAPEPSASVPPGDARVRVDLRVTLPPGFEQLPQGPAVKVVGESFHRDAIEAIVGQRPEGHRTIVDAAIAFDPGNPVDPAAVGVWIGGAICGHLSRADAKEWQPIVASYAARGSVPVARGDVSGGWRQPDGTWAEFGITLYAATPRDLAVRQRGIDSRPADENGGRPYDRRTCPYCEAAFDPLPKAKKRCPACGETVYVRSGPDGLRHILRDADLAAHEATWAAYQEARERSEAAEAATEAGRTIAANLREYAALGVLAELVAAGDACPACLALNGRLFDPSAAPSIPVAGCVNELCRCDYAPRV